MPNYANLFEFLRVRSVPKLFWTSPTRLTLFPAPVSALFLVLGLIIFGVGEALLVAASTGVSPWTVLAQGLVVQTGWGLGLATLIISFSVLALWIPLQQVPGLGTILNALIIAAVLEYVLPWIPTPSNRISGLLLAMTGVVITGLGGAIYLIANLGPGPRDGLMTGINEKTGWPIAWIRSGLEVSVVLLGVALGGQFGVGTLLFALGIGPAVALGLHLCKRLFGSVTQTPLP